MGDDIRNAYYVLELVNRLHAHFTGISEAFEISVMASALSKDTWALIFYRDKESQSVAVIKEVFNAAGILAGIIASLAALDTGLIAVIGGVIASLFNGVTILHTLLSVNSKRILICGASFDASIYIAAIW